MDDQTSPHKIGLMVKTICQDKLDSSFSEYNDCNK